MVEKKVRFFENSESILKAPYPNFQNKKKLKVNDLSAAQNTRPISSYNAYKDYKL